MSFIFNIMALVQYVYAHTECHANTYALIFIQGT